MATALAAGASPHGRCNIGLRGGATAGLAAGRQLPQAPLPLCWGQPLWTAGLPAASSAGVVAAGVAVVVTKARRALPG